MPWQQASAESEQAVLSPGVSAQYEPRAH